MTEALQDEVCIESQTHSCCEGGKGPTPWRDRAKPTMIYTDMSNPDIEEAIEGIGLKTTSDLLAERAQDYGPPEINMTGIGLIWTAQLRNHYGIADLPVLSGQMVALMMAGLKLNRLAKSPDHQDSYDDLGGYAEIAKRLA